jgi:hypothetical protein
MTELRGIAQGDEQALEQAINLGPVSPSQPTWPPATEPLSC